MAATGSAALVVGASSLLRNKRNHDRRATTTTPPPIQSGAGLLDVVSACACERVPAAELVFSLVGSPGVLGFSRSRTERLACALLAACFFELGRAVALLVGEAAISTTSPHFGHFVCEVRELEGATKE